MRRPPPWARARHVVFALLALLGACATSSDSSPDRLDVEPGHAAGHDAADTLEDACADCEDAALDAAPNTDAADMDAIVSDAEQTDAAVPEAATEDGELQPMADAALDAGMDAAQPACVPFEAPGDCTVPSGAVLPSELRCTGLYSDFAARRLACGVEGYTPAYQLWSDGAEKSRFIALPEGSKIDISDAEGFVFPVGTKLWKEFRVQHQGSWRPGETRLLQKSAQGWLYTTYVWSEDGQRAVQENDGVADLFGTGHGVPTRDQCRACHEGRADFALGFDPLLLGPGAQGLTFERLLAQGLVRGARESDGAGYRVPGDDVERAALGYLHANCGVSCHNETTRADAHDTGLFLRLDLASLSSVQATATVRTGVNRLPGIHAKLPPGGPYYDIRPGDAAHSLLVARMNVRGDASQMPRIATRRVDATGLDVVTRFIDQMSAARGYPAAEPVEGGVVGTPLDAGLPDAASPEEAGAPDTSAPDASPEPDSAAPDAGVPSCQVATPPSTANLGYQIVVRDSSLQTLSFAAQAPGSDDWYLVEMRGRILRLHEGVLESTAFLDLRSAIDLGAGFDQTTASYDERGLVGLAFAPDYVSSGLFYIAITPSKSNALGLAVNHDMVLEYQRPASSGGTPTLRRTLVDLPSASAYLGNIHNINTVRFGPDGMLYVGSGDGGGVNCNDAELNAAQNIASPFGKILRLDLSQPAPYAAQDNPFVQGGDARVLHYGVRNPFRFSFDRATGDLYFGDVGQNRYEEINHVPSGSRGVNFGWATYEALNSCGQNRPLRPGATVTQPIFVADRTGTGTFSDYRAITGGIVYRGSALPQLSGAYLFGDYYGKRLAALYRCGGQTSSVSVLRKACDPNFPEACLPTPAAATAFTTLTAIVEDHAGEIYFVASGNSLLKLVSR